MRDICYLLDENVNPHLRTGLLRRESQLAVWKVGDPGAPFRTSSDPAILCWCEDNGFILVTNNRKSIPRHLQDHIAEGRHVPGIFILNSNMNLGEAIEDLLPIWEASAAHEYRDAIIYLPLG